MNLSIDVHDMMSFLLKLLAIPSPCGDTTAAAEFVRDSFGILPLETSIERKGHLVATWDGSEDGAPRGVCAHIDTLGAVVSQVKDNGRLRISRIGSWVWNSIEGENVTVFPRNCAPVSGTALPVHASWHSYEEKMRTAPRDEQSMEVRLDLITETAEQTQELGISVGDLVSFQPRTVHTETGFVKSRHLDDKAGVACIYGALRAIESAGLCPRRRTTILITGHEEVGHGGSAGMPKDTEELLVVDMGISAVGRSGDERGVTICAKDSNGPYDLRLRRLLENTAEELDLRWSTDVFPYYGSDGAAFLGAGGNAAVALIGPGIDASHHYERTHCNALRDTALLIAGFLMT
jgi:putative aminopeptidase FrvX